jgi:hypothetical protein
MAETRCSCGFREGADETMTDHLLEAFTPRACRGNDGHLHEEAFPALTCLCGFAAATGQELDEHFLAVFTPGDRVGLDGRVHATNW